jgi:hypothetical protein
MKDLFRILSLVAILVTFIPTDFLQSLEARQVDAPVAAILADLAARPFGQTMADWETRAKGVSWQRHRGALGLAPPSDIWGKARNWCAMGHDSIAGVGRESLFYPLRSEQPLACRLEQLRYTAAGGSSPRTTYLAMARGLERAYGEPYIDGAEEDPGPRHTRTTSFYPRPWDPLPYARRWHRPSSTVFLFVDKTDVHVIAQTHVLAKFDFGVGSPSAVWHRFGHSRAVWEVANEVRAQFPEAAEIILSSQPVDDEAQIARVAIALLERGSSRAGDERSVLKLAASLVLDRLRIHEVTFDEHLPRLPARPDVTRLTALGARLEFDTHSAVWRNSRNLWDDVIRDSPASWWGELAFVERLEGGWSRECGDDYKDVIREGQGWLPKHDSPLSARVILAVAEAYETWWSLGQAPKDEDDMVDAEEHRPGAREARGWAIAWYERLFRQKPDTTESHDALGSYIRLLENIDTGSRRFFCRIP